MRQLLEVMRNINFVTDWYELGLWLHVSDVDLKIFKADSTTDVTDRCQKMFQKWLEKTCSANWSQLVTALDKIKLLKPSVNIANQVIYTYTQLHPVCFKFQYHKFILNLSIYIINCMISNNYMVTTYMHACPFRAQ